MSETKKTDAATTNEVVAYLIRRTERRINQSEAVIEERMESLTSDFNGQFEWDAEAIYKHNLRLDYFRNLRATLAEEGCDNDRAKFLLKHSVEHLADDIMMCDPYRDSSNPVVNLTHRWEYEAKKEIRGIIINMIGSIPE